MKILITGDSFAADWSVKYPVTGWPNMLAREHDVTNIAQAGCSEYRILKQIESQHLSEYDAVIVSHTSPYRVHTAYHPAHAGDALHGNSDFIYNDVKAHDIHSMVEYFEKFYDLDYARDMHNLICRRIDYLTFPYSGVIHITHFDWQKLFQFTFMTNFVGIHKQHPGDANHYSTTGNELVLAKLNERLASI